MPFSDGFPLNLKTDLLYRSLLEIMLFKHLKLDIITTQLVCIFFYRKGSYYKLSVYAPDNDGKDRLLTPAEILPIIEHIIKDAEGLPHLRTMLYDSSI